MDQTLKSLLLPILVLMLMAIAEANPLTVSRVSETPKTPKTPKSLETPKTPEISGTPKTSATPKTPETPKTPKKLTLAQTCL
jgi:hypothetical protein